MEAEGRRAEDKDQDGEEVHVDEHDHDGDDVCVEDDQLYG